MTERIYNGKVLSAYDLWELGAILKSLNEAQAKREQASKHPKFDRMQFPTINPEFLKLKSDIEEAIKAKQNA